MIVQSRERRYKHKDGKKTYTICARILDCCYVCGRAISGLVPGLALQTTSRLGYASNAIATNALNAVDAPSAPYRTRLRCTSPSRPA